MDPDPKIDPSFIRTVPPERESVADEDKAKVMLAYLGIFALIPLLTSRQAPFLQWHAKNGLVLGLGGLIALALLSLVLQPLGCLGVLVDISGLCTLAVIDLIAMSRALRGERWRIPWVSDLADRL